MPKPAPRESAKALAAYALYEAMGPERSLAKVAGGFGQSVGKVLVGRLPTLERWSAAYGWVERAAAADMRQIARERQEREAAEAKHRQRKYERELRREEAREKMDDDRATVMRGEWPKVLKTINEKVDDGEMRGLLGLVQLLRLALDEERLSLGSATAISQLDVTTNGESLTDPLEALLGQLARLATRSGTASGAGGVDAGPGGGAAL